MRAVRWRRQRPSKLTGEATAASSCHRLSGCSRGVEPKCDRSRHSSCRTSPTTIHEGRIRSASLTSRRRGSPRRPEVGLTGLHRDHVRQRHPQLEDLLDRDEALACGDRRVQAVEQRHLCEQTCVSLAELPQPGSTGDETTAPAPARRRAGGPARCSPRTTRENPPSVAPARDKPGDAQRACTRCGRLTDTPAASWHRRAPAEGPARSAALGGIYRSTTKAILQCTL